MAGGLLNLPINIPWKLIGVSPDMMDTRFCNKHFPFAWRSSLAISAYEPRPEELPEDLCEGRITFLKVTCTITGYQPSKEETRDITTILPSFSDEPTEDQREAIERILNEYFTCYGALLNVAVFPLSKTKKELVERARIDFGQLDDTEPGSLLPNPFEWGGMKFDALDQENNRIVDIFPEGGDGSGELDLHRKMVVTFPGASQVDKVDATVVHYATTGVAMEAFKGSESLGTHKAGLEQGEEHALSIEGEGIDQVVFTAPENEASLLEFAYSVAKEVSTGLEDIDLGDYPHIIDFEPKMRDLYQTATETGELLTASISKVKTDKSFTHTETTETGLSLKAMYAPKGEKGSQISGSLSHKWGETDQDQWTVETDASRERRETEGTTTQVSQMYNLLTGYHSGTNRAVFLMLARPHVLQPTDFRTFVQGLRAIEGVQEFFLIVARPEDVDGLCVETFLETGHFPEDTRIVEPEAEYYESYEDFIVTAFADNSTVFQNCEDIENDESATYTISSGWVIDRREKRKRRPGEPKGSGWEDSHPGVAEIDDNSNSQANESLDRYGYGATSEISVGVWGRICGSRGQGAKARFNRTYRVFTRSEHPIRSYEQPQADIERLLITSRGLCVCFRSGECPEVLPPPEPPIIERSIVDEPIIKMNPALLTREVSSQTRLPAMKELLRKIQVAMTTSWRRPRRYPLGEVGFLESEYFKGRINKVLPNEHLETRLTQVSGLPEAVVKSLGEACTVAEALDMDLTSFAKETGLSMEEAGKARRRLLRIAPRRSEEHEGTG